MALTPRHGLAAVALGLAVLLLGGLTGSTASASDGTVTTIGPGYWPEVELSATDTGRAATSFAAATSICDFKILPVAQGYHSLADLEFPSCQVAVQLCAMQALDNGVNAVVRLYDDFFDCRSDL